MPEFPLMKSCRVYYREPGGVEHRIFVSAVNRYHAFGLAMHEIRRRSWCGVDCSEIGGISIERLDLPKKSAPAERIAVTRDEFERWLNDPAHPPERDRLRRYLMMLLGRIEPDRDFKRELKAR